MKRILIIEDDEPLLWLTERIVSKEYEVISTTSSIEGWCWLTEGNYPDLIVSDISMPVMNGFELLENLKSSSLFKHIPVIILSNFTDPRKRKKSLDLGAAEFIEKPFEPKFLLNNINKVLQSVNTETYV